jgi:hypothetical protein
MNQPLLDIEAIKSFVLSLNMHCKKMQLPEDNHAQRNATVNNFISELDHYTLRKKPTARAAKNDESN